LAVALDQLIEDLAARGIRQRLEDITHATEYMQATTCLSTHPGWRLIRDQRVYVEQNRELHSHGVPTALGDPGEERGRVEVAGAETVHVLRVRGERRDAPLQRVGH